MIASGTIDLFLFQNNLLSSTATGNSVGPYVGQTYVNIPPPPTGEFGIGGFSACEGGSLVQTYGLLQGLSVWTVEFRAFIASSNDGVILGWKDGDFFSGFVGLTDGSFFFYFTDFFVAVPAGTVTLNAYSYFAMTSDGTTRRCYINNVEVGATTFGVTFGPLQTLAAIGINPLNCALTAATNYVMSNLRFSSVVRTEFPTVDPVPEIPQTPIVGYFLRKDDHSLLRWSPITRDIFGNPGFVQGYHIYRSTNRNLETFTRIATITDLDVTGLIATFFSEVIVGFYAYGVTAFNETGESVMVTAEAVNSTISQDLLG